MLINFFSRFIILIYLIGIGNLLIAQTPKDFSLDLCASTSLHTLDTTRTIVTIKWSSAATTPLATGYRYKTKSAVLWNSITLLTAADTSFIDTIPTSSEREYQVLVDTSGVVNDYIKYGNILVGRKIPATLQHGRLLVLIDSAYLNVLDTAIEQYRFDLIGDGFIPVFKYVNRTTSVTTIKSYILNAYNVTVTPFFGVVLLGHIPVPYSGDYKATGTFPPDGHTTTLSPPSHEGAWATDLYYGDMSPSTLWTDTTVTNTLGARTANNNSPSDGKFDQTSMPSAIEVPVGRVDLYDLPAFSQSDTQLMLRYLNKNHNYRAGLTNYRSRLLQDDELGLLTGEPFGANSYQIANPIWGDSVDKLDWSTLTTNNYQWAQGYGYGSYTSCVNVVSTANFAANNYKTTFTSLFGSYFGDFDISNNLLRAALASEGEILTSVWSGRPKWYFHQMGTGNPIGLSTLMSQNSWNGLNLVYPDALYGAGLVHPSFHGDITIKLYPYEAIDNFVVRQDSCSNRFILSWDRNNEPGVIEYVVQRSSSLDSTFLNLSVTTTDSFYMDSFPLSGTNYYMVRAVQEVNNCSGMHYNLSHGSIDSIVFQVPEALAGRDTTNCMNIEVPIGLGSSFDSIYQFYWSPGNVLTDSTERYPVWAISQNQSFYLNVYDSLSGCMVQDTLEIIAIPSPTDTIMPPIPTNSCGDTISISSSQSATGFNYNWTIESGTPSSFTGINQTGPLDISWINSGSYLIRMNVTDPTNSCTSVDSINHFVACILPLNLLSISSAYDDNCARILTQWATTSEYNLVGYRLDYYSNNDLIHSAEIASKSIGIDHINSYSALFEPKHKVNYIKLYELDNNGSATFVREQRTLSQSCKNGIAIFPNPIELNQGNQLFIEGIRGLEQMNIINSTGQKVLSLSLNPKTNSLIYNLDDQLKAGIYFLELGGQKIKLLIY